MSDLLYCHACDTKEGCRSVGRCQLRPTSSSVTREIPVELFDGHAVFQEALRHAGPNCTLRSHHVSAVLDAVVRLIRAATPAVLAKPDDCGPWSVVQETKCTNILSDDFRHDVTISIYGDFASPDERLAYAHNIVKRLCAAVPAAGERKKGVTIPVALYLDLIKWFEMLEDSRGLDGDGLPQRLNDAAHESASSSATPITTEPDDVDGAAPGEHPGAEADCRSQPGSTTSSTTAKPGEQTLRDIVASDAFRNTLLPRADAYTPAPSNYPLWHGWALMDAFLAGASFARSARERFQPTHQHADGGHYQSLGAGKVRMDDAWVDGWFYRAEDGAIYATSLLRWNARFTTIEAP